MNNTEHSIKMLQDYAKEGVATCVIVWVTYDVIERAKQLGIECTEEQANDIIEYMERKQDSENGVTWDTIDYHLTSLCREWIGLQTNIIAIYDIKKGEPICQ